MTLPVEEFLRRFLLHLLPPGFVRIRNFGFLANRNRATLLPLCFRLLGGLEKTTSSAEPCMWSNGSLPRNSCFALHLDRASALHESPSAFSPSTRASACTPIPCLISPGALCPQSLPPLPDAERAASRLHPAITLADHNYQGNFLTLRTCSALFKVRSLP